MNFQEFPRFTKETSCAYSHNPDLWFPEEKSGHVAWSYTPGAMLARSICKGCPAREECLEYSLQFSNLSGIWAGLDRHERKAEQLTRGITPQPVYVTINARKEA